MKSILFVDDEPNVLSGLNRMLRNTRDKWDIRFAKSGEEALNMLAENFADVVVSDMRMPNMDGAELLSQVAKIYPRAARIILSGHSELELALKSATAAHQYLSKPCDMECLKSTIKRVCALRELLDNVDLIEMVGQLNKLPSMPDLFYQLTELMQKPETSIEQVGDIISQDIALSAKILQLVNSAFFGIPRHITSPADAAVFLGTEVIRGLVCSVAAFSSIDTESVKDLDVANLSHQGLQIGAFAKKIAVTEKQPTIIIEHALIAGFMHDVGKLAFVANKPEQYMQAMINAKAKNIGDYRSELEIFGHSHADVGAYLLGLWGMPNNVVEAVAYHHCPQECPNQEFLPLTALYAALAIDEEMRQECHPVFPLIYLEEQGYSKDKLDKWREVCCEAS